MKQFALLLVVGSALAGCSSTTTDVVTLSEFQIEATSMLPAGATSLTVVNDGEFPHSLVVSTASGEVITSSPVVQPGTTTQLEVDLERGEYQLTCRIVVDVPGVGLVDHYAEGMESALIVDG